MGRYRYAGTHADAIVYEASQDGSARLEAWRDRSVFSGDDVYLEDVQTPYCRVVLPLPNTQIDLTANWQAGRFSLPADHLDIVVEADSPKACYDVLKQTLFARFDAQPESGKAHFPVWASSQNADPGSSDRVMAAQEGTQIEYLTVTITAEQGASRFWVSEA